MDHVRDHRSLLARAEKRLLVWTASRLPSWVTPDHLSLLGLSAMAFAGAGFAAAGLSRRTNLVVIVALAVNWFGDSLDGTLARVRNQQRPRYGFYVDHVIDLVGTTFLAGGLALSGLMSPLLALALLTAYLLVSAESYLATHASGVFRMAFLGVGPTELRILLAAGAVYAGTKPSIWLGSFGPYRLFDIGGAVAIVGLLIAFVAAAARQTRALYIADPVPHRGDRAPFANAAATKDAMSLL